MEFYLLTFPGATQCMRAEKRADGRLRVAVIPVPTEITADCGFALRFYSGQPADFTAFFAALDTDCALYRIACVDGVRRAYELCRKEGLA